MMRNVVGMMRFGQVMSLFEFKGTASHILEGAVNGFTHRRMCEDKYKGCINVKSFKHEPPRQGKGKLRPLGMNDGKVGMLLLKGLHHPTRGCC